MEKTPRLLIVAAEFQPEIVEAMVRAAVDEAKRTNLNVVREIRVSGCYETPLVVDTALASDTIDLAVVLGYIERGETLHGEVMGHVVQSALVRTQLVTRKPVGIGIIGPGATLEQARTRMEPCARTAVRAAARNLAILRELRAG